MIAFAARWPGSAFFGFSQSFFSCGTDHACSNPPHFSPGSKYFFFLSQIRRMLPQRSLEIKIEPFPRQTCRAARKHETPGRMPPPIDQFLLLLVCPTFMSDPPIYEPHGDLDPPSASSCDGRANVIKVTLCSPIAFLPLFLSRSGSRSLCHVFLVRLSRDHIYLLPLQP